MKLPIDPRLPVPELSLDYLRRLNARVYELWRLLTGQVNPYLSAGWDDLRFPVQGINPAGTANAPSVDTTTYPGTLLFSGTADNHVAGVAQLPHAWVEGSEIKPHIHWTKTTADGSGLAVSWQFRYSLVKVGGTPTAYTSWIDGTLGAGDLTTQEKQNITGFGPIDLTGYKGSTIVLWELRRVGSDAYNSQARLLEVDFHYRTGSNGSEQEYPT